MKIEVVAAVCEALYYNGNVKAGSEKLDEDDFMQLTKTAHGAIMRKIYYEQKQIGGEMLYFAEMLDIKECHVKKMGQYVYVSPPEELITLPYGMGVFGLYPQKDGIGSMPIIKQAVGADWVYSGDDFEHIRFYIKKGRRLFIYNSELNEGDIVMLEGIFNEDDIDVPYDICFDIINQVMALSLRVVGFPIDQTDDNNPNVQTVKARLADPASL